MTEASAFDEHYSRRVIEMIGRRAVLGLSLLSALLFCAFAAQSASAAPGKNTTAFTCVENGKGDFTDAHCDKKGANPGKEKFAHVAIANGTVTKVTATNEKTDAATTTKSTDATLKGTPFGVKTHIICKTVHGTGTMTNSEPVTNEHKITGKITTKFTNCEVKEPPKCTLKEVVAKAEVEGVEELEGKKEMGLEFKPEGVEPFASITLEGAGCSIVGKTFPVTGTAIGTGGTATQAEKHSGSTVNFTEAMTKKTLTAGGKEAILIASTTVRMEKVAEKVEPPISLTTVT